MNDRLFAVIPCAGVGTRAGAKLPKQYRTVAGRNLLYFALAAFDACSELAQTLVVLAPEDGHFDPRRFTGLRFAVRRCGGATRQDTVFNGLNALLEFGVRPNDWVLVHDAARPGIQPELIRSLVAGVRDDPVGGILALPLADTLKRVDAGDAAAQARIARTESRDQLWLAQTPQMFRYGLLCDALKKARAQSHPLTDEASALEWLGHRPRIVHGSPLNFKVTFPEDFLLADALLSNKADLRTEVTRAPLKP